MNSVNPSDPFVIPLIPCPCQPAVLRPPAFFSLSLLPSFIAGLRRTQLVRMPAPARQFPTPHDIMIALPGCVFKLQSLLLPEECNIHAFSQKFNTQF